MSRLCACCQSVDLSQFHRARKYCLACTTLHRVKSGASQAVTAVSRAVAKGQLPHIKTQTCVDCGAQAANYDHRDYGKPLEVEPVCVRWNLKRGPARPAPLLDVIRARLKQAT